MLNCLIYCLDQEIVNIVKEVAEGARKIVAATVTAGVATPAFAVSLSYFDNFTCARMPSNLTQAQRDYFGAHTYELVGKDGTFHTQWAPKS